MRSLSSARSKQRRLSGLENPYEPNHDDGTRIAPGPRRNALISALLGRQEQDILAGYIDLWREYGDVVRLKAGPLVIHQIVRPEHVRHVMVQNATNYPKGMSHDKLRIALGNGGDA